LQRLRLLHNFFKAQFNLPTLEPFSPYTITTSSLWHSLPPRHAFPHSQKFATTSHPLIGRIVDDMSKKTPTLAATSSYQHRPPNFYMHTCHHAPHMLASSERIGKSIWIHRQWIYSIQRGDMRDNWLQGAALQTTRSTPMSEKHRHCMGRILHVLNIRYRYIIYNKFSPQRRLH